MRQPKKNDDKQEIKSKITTKHPLVFMILI